MANASIRYEAGHEHAHEVRAARIAVYFKVMMIRRADAPDLVRWRVHHSVQETRLFGAR
jgi:hypothetical protein